MLLSAHATCQALPVNIDINSNSLVGRGPGGRTHISSFSPGKCDRSEGQMLWDLPGGCKHETIQFVLLCSDEVTCGNVGDWGGISSTRSPALTLYCWLQWPACWLESVTTIQGAQFRLFTSELTIGAPLTLHSPNCQLLAKILIGANHEVDDLDWLGVTLLSNISGRHKGSS